MKKSKIFKATLLLFIVSITLIAISGMIKSERYEQLVKNNENKDEFVIMFDTFLFIGVGIGLPLWAMTGMLDVLLPKKKNRLRKEMVKDEK